MFDNFNPQPKKHHTKKKKPPTAKEIAHLLFVKSCPCITCAAPPPSQAHHITSGGRRLGHYYCLPLCYECHEGKFSIGNSKKSFVAKYGAEMLLLEKFVRENNLDIEI